VGPVGDGAAGIVDEGVYLIRFGDQSQLDDLGDQPDGVQVSSHAVLQVGEALAGVEQPVQVAVIGWCVRDGAPMVVDAAGRWWRFSRGSV
jgi:hypothetical protein